MRLIVVQFIISIVVGYLYMGFLVAYNYSKFTNHLDSYIEWIEVIIMWPWYIKYLK